MQPLPPSRAPLLFGVGLAVVLIGTVLRFLGSVSAVVSLAGLAIFVAGAFAAWLRLTGGGRVIVALPVVAWVGAFVAASLGATPVVAQSTAFGAALLSLLAFVFVVQPLGGLSGARRGKIDSAVVRTLADDGAVECSLEGGTLTIKGPRGEPSTHPLDELGAPRLEDKKTHCDLVLADRFGDLVLRLRGTTDDEREGLKALAAELERRAPST